MPKSEFRQLLDLVFKNGYLCFLGNWYQIPDGVPMGLPVAPIAANFVLSALLDSVIPSLPFHVPLLY